MINVYLDGSSNNNGKANCVAGWSCIILIDDNNPIISYGHLECPSSNNRAELFGMYYLLHFFNLSNKNLKLMDCNIYSDAQYLVKGINDWSKNWIKKNFEGVKNTDLFIPIIDNFRKYPKMKIAWIKGHSGNIYNDLADYYARQGTSKIDLTSKKDSIYYINSKEIIL